MAPQDKNPIPLESGDLQQIIFALLLMNTPPNAIRLHGVSSKAKIAQPTRILLFMTVSFLATIATLR